MKIAIFGGSFDPPHIGHDKIVHLALKTLNLDKLFIIPAWQNPLKDSTCAPSDLRLKWVQKLWANLEKVEICKFEIEQNRAVRSYESVMYLKNLTKFEICYFIIGADNVESLHKWYKIDELKKECKFIIATRDGFEIPTNLQKIDINANISSTKFRNDLRKDFIPQLIKDEVMSYYQGNKCKKD